MRKPDTPTSRPRPGASTEECCTDHTCASGLRNHYFEGKRLSSDMFRVEQQYLNERRRLLNRAIHGHGVVYGYDVQLRTPKSGRKDRSTARLWIGEGLALDACGRELLHLSLEQGLKDLIALDADGAPTNLDGLMAPEMCWLLRAHYAERRTDPVTVKDRCNCEREEWDHVCETVRFSLQAVPCDTCCTGCACEWTCQCATDPCCCGHEHAAQKAAAAQHPPEPRGQTDAPPPFQRGGCRCLCDHVTGLTLPACTHHLHEIDDPCATVSVDLANGVPLACLQLEPDDCGAWTVKGVDACGPRRLVKRNDLLFDLIRGCDLTFIDDFGWKAWHREPNAIPFDAFAPAIGPDGGDGEEEYIARDFWVTFSRPVRKETLTADCFAFTVLSLASEGRWLAAQRVPITRVEHLPSVPATTDLVRGAHLVFDGGWVEDAIWGRGNVFTPDPEKHLSISIEVEVRGDFILDCNGQPVDANAVGRSRRRTGNGTPGGTFVSAFQVAPRERPPHGKRGQGDQLSRKGAAS